MIRHSQRARRTTPMNDLIALNELAFKLGDYLQMTTEVAMRTFGKPVYQEQMMGMAVLGVLTIARRNPDWLEAITKGLDDAGDIEELERAFMATFAAKDD